MWGLCLEHQAAAPILCWATDVSRRVLIVPPAGLTDCTLQQKTLLFEPPQHIRGAKQVRDEWSGGGRPVGFLKSAVIVPGVWQRRRSGDRTGAGNQALGFLPAGP